MAVLIHQRVNEIRSAESIEQMIQFSIGRCHRLKGNKKDFYAMDLIHPYRLIISKDGAMVCCTKIEAIEDYH
jgi:proteic killer suppression protein